MAAILATHEKSRVNLSFSVDGMLWEHYFGKSEIYWQAELVAKAVINVRSMFYFSYESLCIFISNILTYLQLWLFNIFFFLILTLIIAALTLIERKVLALVQRRVGPNYIGYKGRLQFIADALKLLAKHIVIINWVNKFFFLLLPALCLVMCYLFWINLIWGPNLSIFEIEYNLLFMSILSIIFTILLFLIGWVTQNKYAILSSSRLLVININLEIFLNFLIIYFLIISENFSFFQLVNLQNNYLYNILLLLPVLPIILIIFLLETGRIPFDLGEAESELIAGYTVEMGGFFFALFYLGEYFHLYCFSITYSLCLFGGWFII